MKLKDLRVPQRLKKEFRKIWGKLYSSCKEAKFPFNRKIIAVGDITGYSLIKAGYEPWIIVFDGKVEREEADKEIVETLEKYCERGYMVRNPPSHITSELWGAVKKSLREKSKVKIFVKGEEDLAAFPFILEAEENNIIAHGFRKKGIVVMEVNKRIKNKGRKLLNKLMGL